MPRTLEARLNKIKLLRIELFSELAGLSNVSTDVMEDEAYKIIADLHYVLPPNSELRSELEEKKLLNCGNNSDED